MADRFPLILNTSTNQIQEIASGDNLDLTGSGIHNAGIITATQIDLNGDIDVDGHTNLDNLSVAGVSTFTGNADFSAGVDVTGDINVTSTLPVINLIDSNNNDDFAIKNVNGVFTIRDATNGADRLTIDSNGKTTFPNDVDLSSTLTIESTQPTIQLNDTNANDDFAIRNVDGVFGVRDITNGADRFTINSSGVVNIPGNTDFGAGIDVTGNATVSGNLSVGGVLTYEDVTNVDSVGIITARSGINLTGGNITLGDTSDGSSDDLLIFGAGSDLKIYHDSNHSYIQNATGDLFIKSNADDLVLQAADDVLIRPQNGEDGIKVIGDGAVELYFNNEVRYATSGYGANIFGQNAAVSFNLYTAGGTKRGGLYATNGNVISLLDGQDHQILRGVKDGTAELYFDNAKKIETTSTGAVVTGKLSIGANTSGKPLHVGTYGSGNGEIALASSTTGYGSILFGDSASGTDVYKGYLQYNHNTDRMLIATNAGTRITILSDGKTGINNTSPTESLDVTGNIAVSGTVDGVDIAALNTTIGNKLANVVEDTSPQLGGDLDCNNKVVTLNDSTGAGNNRFKIGNAGDLQIYHGSNHNYVSGETDGIDFTLRGRRDLYLQCGNNSSGYRNVIYADNNGTTRLYHPASNAEKLRSMTTGASVTGTLCVGTTATPAYDGVRIYKDSGNIFYQVSMNGDGVAGTLIGRSGSKNFRLQQSETADIEFWTSNTKRINLTSTGNFEPETNNDVNLGSTSKRFANVYVNDLQLSNKAKKDEGGNDVDGTWGDFTIQEGKSDLFLINNRSGKKYKFNLTEVS